MTPPAADIRPDSPHQQLAEAVRITVGSFLGTGFSRGPSDSNLGPIAAGILFASPYAVLAIVQMVFAPASRELILLSWWGTIYLGIVVALTRSTSLAVIEIVELLILPNVSEEFAISARKEILKDFVKPRILVKSLGAASVAIFVSCLILHRQYSWPLLVLWAPGFFVLYFTASQATLTAPFYKSFGHSLRRHSADLFAIDPAASPAVSACTTLARRVLFYWFLVFLLVISLLAVPVLMNAPVAARFASAPAADLSRFISTVVFVASFFSFFFGSLVYLRFESDLRIGVEHVRLAALSTLQADYRNLLAGPRALSTDECAQLDRLKTASTHLSQSGYLRNSLQTLGSVFAVILPPLVSIIVGLLTYYKKP
jgi:hypothetical protein